MERFVPDKLVCLALIFLFAGGDGAVAASKKSHATMRPKPSASPAATELQRRAGAEQKLPASMLQAVPIIPPEMTELPLVAKGAVVVDEYTGESLYEKNADESQYPASTTKILTALLVIEEGSLDKEVEVTIEDSKVGESSLEIKPGDRFTRREALYGLLLKSANDVAHALARDNAGSVEAFAEKMTVRAKELGAVNSHFENPHGLHHPAHYTTPHDLACIARAAMQQPFFRSIVGSQFHTWLGNPATGARELRNHNRLLWKFPGCTGVKTGYTVPAQQVLVSAATWGTRECISVVMHTGKPGIWEDSKLLLTWGLEHLPPIPSPAAEPHLDAPALSMSRR